jgi:hypothetical protein
VDELVVRGADPNLLDKDSCSVMNGAISHEQWGTVKLLIEYMANIHKKAPIASDWSSLRTPLQLSDSSDDDDCQDSSSTQNTPLQHLISKRQGELIQHTLMWCPDQEKGVNDAGETTLHAIALDKNRKLLYRQVVRGVNPLSLTKNGCSVLLYAVRNPHCPRRMVAECIKLGFSTHQPALTQQSKRDQHSYWKDVITAWLTGLLINREIVITSLFLLSVVHGMNVVAHMLYESGSCSPTELLHLY